MGPHPPRKDLQEVISTWVGALSISPNHSPSPPPSPCPGSPVSRLTAHSGLLTSCKPRLVRRALGFRGRGAGRGAPQAGRLASVRLPLMQPSPGEALSGKPKCGGPFVSSSPPELSTGAGSTRAGAEGSGLGLEEGGVGGGREEEPEEPSPTATLVSWATGQPAIIFQPLINTAGPHVPGWGEGVTGRTSRPEEARSSAHKASCSDRAKKGAFQVISCGHHRAVPPSTRPLAPASGLGPLTSSQ